MGVRRVGIWQVNPRDVLVGARFLLREMLCFLVYMCSLNLVLAYLSPSAVGLAWDVTRGGGSDRPADTRQ